MASDFILATKAVNVSAAAVCALLDGGWLCIYGGAKPATADRSVSSQPCLAEIPLPQPAFGAPVQGIVKANKIGTAITDAAARQATWFRAYTLDHVTPVFDGTVGLAKVAAGDETPEPSAFDFDLLLDRVVIGGGIQVEIVQLTYQAPK